MKRRRFLSIAAGFAAYPAFAAAPLRWQGIALGAEARLELVGPGAVTRPALRAGLAALREAEALFSLYDERSTLARLNREGVLLDAPRLFQTLLGHVDHVHGLTGGLFDPTIQTAWAALARGETAPDWARVGWHHVGHGGGAVRLAPGQQVTFNGIAQGFATDLVADALRRNGLEDAFVDIGEQRAWGAARRLGLVDPEHGAVGALSLRDGAMATSSPMATPLGAGGHILHPRGAAAPIWSSVTVEAESAVLADGLSTALCLASKDDAARIAQAAGVRRIVLVDPDGNVRSL